MTQQPQTPSHTDGELAVVVRERVTEARFTIKPGCRVVLGREPDCDVILPCSSISRHYLAFTNVQGACHVEVISARQHVFLNREVLEKKTPLLPGDEVYAAGFRFVIDGSGHEFEPISDEERDLAVRRMIRSFW